MSPIDRYLTALNGALGEQIPPAERAARLREVRGHLEAAAREVGPEEAARRFGPVSAVAGDLVRQSRGYPTRSVWALGFVVATSLALAYLGPMAWTSYLGAGSVRWPLAVIGFVLPPFALGMFAVQVARTRRWLVVPAALALGLAFAAGFPLAIDRTTASGGSRVEALRGEVAYWRRDLANVRLWQSGTIPPHTRPVWQSSESSKLLPLLMLPYRTERSAHISLEPTRDPDPAAWARYGPAWAAYVEGQLRIAEANLRHPPTNWFAEVGFDWSHAARDWGEQAVLATLVLAATNALVLMVAGRRERRPGPEWAR